VTRNPVHRVSGVRSGLAAVLLLLLAGLVAAQEVDDALIWQVTKSLDRIYQRTRARLLERESNGDTDVPQRRVEPHPAVEDLLVRIGR